VTAYGLFVEHYEKDEVIWNGTNGTDVFFQNEMPYDPPHQKAWRANPTTDGYPAFLITLKPGPRKPRRRYGSRRTFGGMSRGRRYRKRCTDFPPELTLFPKRNIDEKR
jgi:hypothetical protein